MNTDEKILKALERQEIAIEGIHTGLEQQGKTLETLKADVTSLKQGQVQTNERLSTIEQVQKEQSTTNAHITAALDALKSWTG